MHSKDPDCSAHYPCTIRSSSGSGFRPLHTLRHQQFYGLRKILRTFRWLFERWLRQSTRWMGQSIPTRNSYTFGGYRRFPGQTGACRKIQSAEASCGFPRSLRLIQLTLIIHGTEDVIVPIDSSRALKELIPNSELVELSGCGHVPTMTRPREVYEAILNYYPALT